MRVEQHEENVFEIHFDHNEMVVLHAADDHLYKSPFEIITASLEETIRIMAITFASQDKLQKAVEKFNSENETQLAISDMQRLIRKCRL